MKKFNNLIFRPHRLSQYFPNTIHAKMKFDNGLTISVVGGNPFHGNGIDTFEVMDSQGLVWYYLSKHEITILMLKTQNIKTDYDIVSFNEIKKLKLI